MNEKIPPQEYKRILDGIQLENILIKNINAKIDHEILKEGLKININDKSSYTETEDGFVVEDKFSLSSLNKDRKIALKIECTYILSFTSSCKITQDFFDVYKEISLPLNVWPFFREIVNSMTSRMNIPPLTLPLLKR